MKWKRGDGGVGVFLQGNLKDLRTSLPRRVRTEIVFTCQLQIGSCSLGPLGTLQKQWLIWGVADGGVLSLLRTGNPTIRTIHFQK